MLVKLKFHFSDGQQYRDPGMLISDCARKIEFWILLLSTVSQPMHFDVKFSSSNRTLIIMTAIGIAIEACRYQIILVKLTSEFGNGQQYRNLGVLMSIYPSKVELWLIWCSALLESRHVDIKLWEYFWTWLCTMVKSNAIWACRHQFILVNDVCLSLFLGISIFRLPSRACSLMFPARVAIVVNRVPL